MQVVAVAEALLETGALAGGGADVGVVTPYNGQVRMLVVLALLGILLQGIRAVSQLY
jgi:hypothetical protein